MCNIKYETLNVYTVYWQFQLLMARSHENEADSNNSNSLLNNNF